VSDIITRVRRKFGDESAVQVTDADLIRWINDGQRQIVLKNETLLEKTSVADSIVNQQEYTLPADLLILKFVQYRESDTSAYKRLRGMTITDFNEHIDGWADGGVAEGVPQIYTLHMGKIICYPTPGSAITAAFKIYYNRAPVDVTLTSDTPDLPLLYHDTLVSYCLQQAYELDEDPESATGEADKVIQDIDLLRTREDWKVQERYPVITILVEDDW
jgi:hypothetical protein